MTIHARRLWVRLGLTLGQNRTALAVIGVWLLAGVLLYLREPNPPFKAVALALTLVEPGELFGKVYQSLTRFILFGMVASMVVHNVTQRYRPEETCRALASKLSGHVVVIGFTHFGRRVAKLVTDAGQALTVIHPEAKDLDALIREERPLVVGAGCHEHELRDAGVAKAALVVLATDDIDVSAQALHEIRKMNGTCDVLVRCPNEDVGEVLSKAYSARVVSTSRIIAEHLTQEAQREGVRSCVVLGDNSVGRRIVATMAQSQISCSLANAAGDIEALRSAGVGRVDLVILADDDLGDNLLRVDRIRKLDAAVRVVCRVFHDEAAAILTRRPFRCMTFSSSRLALETLVRQGAFSKVGIRQGRGGKEKRNRQQSMNAA